MKRLILLLLMLCGQLSLAQRIEIPQLNSNVDNFTIPIGEQGVILLSQLNSQDFNIRKLNTNLEQTWSANAAVEASQDYVTHSFDGKNLFLLFSRFKSNSYIIFRVNTLNGKIEKFQIISVDRIEISNFKAFNASLFIGGVVNSQAVILFTNLNEKKTRILPSVVKGEAEIQSMDLDTAFQQVNVTYSVGKKAKDYQLLIRSFDEDGNLLGSVQMKPTEEFAMMNGKLSQMNDSLQIVVGTYGHKNTIGSSKGPSSQGFYFQSFIDGELQHTNFQSFTKFTNFFEFLSPKQQERQAKKIKEKAAKGEELRLDYRLLMHEVIRKGDHYIVVAESFYPDYKYNNMGLYGPGMLNMGAFNNFYSPWSMIYNPYRWGYGYYGLYSPFSSYYSPWGYRGYNFYGNNQQFDGWVYTHAIVAELDENGHVLWDHSIPLNDTKEDKLTQKIKTSVVGDQVTLSYSKDNQIISKIISQSGTVEQERIIQIDTENEADRVRKSSKVDLNYWYGPYFIAHGTQSINNTEDGKRDVFFINKIQFNP
jgi:hypothetical protein